MSMVWPVYSAACLQCLHQLSLPVHLHSLLGGWGLSKILPLRRIMSRRLPSRVFSEHLSTLSPTSCVNFRTVPTFHTRWTRFITGWSSSHTSWCSCTSVASAAPFLTTSEVHPSSSLLPLLSLSIRWSLRVTAQGPQGVFQLLGPMHCPFLKNIKI